MSAFVNGHNLGPKLEARVKGWHAEAELFRRRGQDATAVLIESLAEEIERDLGEWEDEPLTIKDAAAESGYSAEHLRRLVREGKLGSERAPGGKSHIRLRRADLPTKPSKRYKEVAENQTSTYDPEEDARSIARLIGGQHG